MNTEQELKTKALSNFHYTLNLKDDDLSKTLKNVFLLGMDCGIEIGKKGGNNDDAVSK